MAHGEGQALPFGMEIVTPFTPLRSEKEGRLETQWVAVFRFNTVNADVVYYQTQPIFPTWTSQLSSFVLHLFTPESPAANAASFSFSGRLPSTVDVTATMPGMGGILNAVE